MNAVCIRCGAAKELALARCPSCTIVPTGDERALSVLASTRLLDASQLVEVQRRILAGEPFRPSRTRLELARATLVGAAQVAPFSLTPRQAVALFLGNVLLTPALGFALWFGVRHRPGLGGRQALWLTVPVSLAIGALWVGLHVHR